MSCSSHHLLGSMPCDTVLKTSPIASLYCSRLLPWLHNASIYSLPGQTQIVAKLVASVLVWLERQTDGLQVSELACVQRSIGEVWVSEYDVSVAHQPALDVRWVSNL